MTDFNFYISNISDGNIGFNNFCSQEETIFNRSRILEKLGFTIKDLVFMQQIHGSRVQIVDVKSSNEALIDTDGIITNIPGIVLMAQSADCALVSLYDSLNNVIGLVHVGWRGVVNGIIPKTIDIMKKKYGTNLKDISIRFSPHAQPCCYEVGEELKNEFFMFPEDVFQKGRENYYLDIGKAIFWQICSYDIPEENIIPSNLCTICSKDYFSYRRDGQNAGRFGMFVWLD